jgi:hypothetical protein
LPEGVAPFEIIARNAKDDGYLERSYAIDEEQLNNAETWPSVFNIAPPGSCDMFQTGQRQPRKRLRK